MYSIRLDRYLWCTSSCTNVWSHLRICFWENNYLKNNSKKVSDIARENCFIQKKNTRENWWLHPLLCSWLVFFFCWPNNHLPLTRLRLWIFNCSSSFRKCIIVILILPVLIVGKVEMLRSHLVLHERCMFKLLIPCRQRSVKSLIPCKVGLRIIFWCT